MYLTCKLYAIGKHIVSTITSDAIGSNWYIWLQTFGLVQDWSLAQCRFGRLYNLKLSQAKP